MERINIQVNNGQITWQQNSDPPSLKQPVQEAKPLPGPKVVWIWLNDYFAFGPSSEPTKESSASSQLSSNLSLPTISTKSIISGLPCPPISLLENFSTPKSPLFLCLVFLYFHSKVHVKTFSFTFELIKSTIIPEIFNFLLFGQVHRESRFLILKKSTYHSRNAQVVTSNLAFAVYYP